MRIKEAELWQWVDDQLPHSPRELVSKNDLRDQAKMAGYTWSSVEPILREMGAHIATAKNGTNKLFVFRSAEDYQDYLESSRKVAQSTILERGWTKSQIKNYLGQPDGLADCSSFI